MARHQVEGGEVPRALAPHLRARGLQGAARGLELGVALGRGRHPGVHGLRLGAREGQVRGGVGQLAVGLARDLGERLDGAVEGVGGRDLCRHRLVVARLGLAHVGDRDEPDLEAPARLRELVGDGRLLAAGEVEVSARGEHGEVALGHPQQQVLLGDGELGAGARHLCVGLPQRDPAVAPEQRLRQAQGVAIVVVGGVVSLSAAVAQPGAAGIGAEADLRQQRGLRLGAALDGRVIGGPRRGELGVALLGEARQGGEVHGLRRERQQGQHGGGCCACERAHSTKRRGRRALSRGGMAVSNRSSRDQASSATRV